MKTIFPALPDDIFDVEHEVLIDGGKEEWIYLYLEQLIERSVYKGVR